MYFYSIKLENLETIIKNLFKCLIISIIFCAVSTQSAFATKYNVKIDIFSNEKCFSRKSFSYCIDFEREINLASLKMTVAGKKNKQVPVYIIPLAKYKAIIYFMPHRQMDEDSELYYVLSFESGKWSGKPAGSNVLKKNIIINQNLVPNYSFENVEKTIDRFLTWSGRTSVINWKLQDFNYKFVSLDKLKSTCRVSTKEAFHGTHSLCFINGKPRLVEGKNILISGSARLSGNISLKPNTAYKLSFFVKITKQIDNGMNFQGVGVSLSLLDYDEKAISGGVFSALYSINSIMQEEYLNKWVYVQTYDVTDQDTYFGSINIAEKISGITYIDMLELREVKNCDFPEIIVGKIIDLTPKKSQPVLRRADGSPLKRLKN